MIGWETRPFLFRSSGKGTDIAADMRNLKGSRQAIGKKGESHYKDNAAADDGDDDEPLQKKENKISHCAECHH